MMAHLLVFSITNSPRNSPLLPLFSIQFLPTLHHDCPLSSPPPPPLTLSLRRTRRRRRSLPRSNPFLLSSSKVPNSLHQNPLLLRWLRQDPTRPRSSHHLRQPLPGPKPLRVPLRQPPKGVEAAASGGG